MEGKELTTSRVESGAIEDLKQQVGMIQALQREILKPDIHYGKVPGTKKDTLFKAGAEKIVTIFRLAPEFETDVIMMEGVHREYRSKCTLVHIPTGKIWGSANGSCNTMESKYRYRFQKNTCPMCNQETIIKGREEYGGGWLCFAKNGGCGAKFPDGDKSIEGQALGKIENQDIADCFNTVLKMAEKRALVAAVLITTGASDIYTQDLEDFRSDYGTSKNITPSVPKQDRSEEKAVKKIIKDKVVAHEGDWKEPEQRMAIAIYEQLTPLPDDFETDMIDVLIQEYIQSAEPV